MSKCEDFVGVWDGDGCHHESCTVAGLSENSRTPVYLMPLVLDIS